MCNITETLPGDTLLQEQGLDGARTSGQHDKKILIGKFVVHVKIYPSKFVQELCNYM